jgi:hypothetical protein
LFFLLQNPIFTQQYHKLTNKKLEQEQPKCSKQKVQIFNKISQQQKSKKKEKKHLSEEKSFKLYYLSAENLTYPEAKIESFLMESIQE